MKLIGQESDEQKGREWKFMSVFRGEHGNVALNLAGNSMPEPARSHCPDQISGASADDAKQQRARSTGQSNEQQQFYIASSQSLQPVARQGQEQGQERRKGCFDRTGTQPGRTGNRQPHQCECAAAEGEPIGYAAVGGILPGTQGQPDE